MPRCEVCGETSRRRLECPECGCMTGPCCRPRKVRGGYRKSWRCAGCEEANQASPTRPLSPEAAARNEAMLRELEALD